MTNEWRIDDGEMRCTHFTATGKLIVYFIKLNLLKYWSNQNWQQRYETYNPLNSRDLNRTKSYIRIKGNHKINYRIHWIMTHHHSISKAII